MTNFRAKWTALAGVTIACLAIWSAGAAVGGGDKAGKYMNERTPQKFLGATQVVLTKFNIMDKEPTSATILLDGNEVTFSAFGDPRITVVFYKPFDVKLTRINMADPTGKERRIFAVELPKDQAEVLGKNSLRLVSPVGAKGQPAGARLLLVDPAGKVSETVELRPVREGV